MPLSSSSRSGGGGDSGEPQSNEGRAQSWDSGLSPSKCQGGSGYRRLAETIRKAIAWDELPRIESTDLFERARTFVLVEKTEGRLLSTSRVSIGNSSGYQEIRAFPKNCASNSVRASDGWSLYDLVKPLTSETTSCFIPNGSMPARSALIDSARDARNGLGCIDEDAAKAGQLPVADDWRPGDKGCRRRCCCSPPSRS